MKPGASNIYVYLKINVIKSLCLDARKVYLFPKIL